MESVSNTEPNTSIGQCHPVSASEDQRQDLEALQGSAACATGTHEPFPVTCMVGLHRRRASVDMLKTCPCKNGIFKKPKICSANCAIHEHGVKHEKPCAIRGFSPKLQAVRTPPPCGKTGTLTLRSRASCLASEHLPPELGPASSCLMPANLRACATTECKKK